ncbi:putative ABC transporter [Legionella longbeachae NSW150]|uniref:Putative ABC transporter n=1 Tax=Legionella longbeachae serogroup 1 (strain NSW150) TaxID=661367 RepID=D3HLM5_LEGLN|nr:ATP-binding cassette domain-containing protein [Legionella longbeachae]CBJ13345.1 putative ABC transporter [Legionella longbeachae NSW150]
MHKFCNIGKVKIILASLNFFKYSAWCGFFIFQGKAIQQAIDKNILIAQLVQTLIWYFLTKLVVMFTDLISKFVVGYFENNEIAAQWRSNFPRTLYQDNESKYNFMYLSYFDYLPNLYNLECTIINNQCTIMSVLVIVTSLLIYTEFYYGLFALFAVFTLNFFSKNTYLKKLEDYHKGINESKASTLAWINQYFKAYREISFNWQGQINPWINSTYNALYQSKKNFIFVQLLRDIMAQLMVELPFIINTSIVITAVYLNYLSITQMFVWIGFSQFVINASNAFLENKVNQDKKRVLINELDEMALSFKDEKEQKLDDMCFANFEFFQVKLQDNTLNKLSFIPGLYHIKGSNGSGKTTLLNSIIGYERKIEVDNHIILKQKLANTAKDNIRVIEREPVIFTSLRTFNEQILGPENTHSLHWNIVLQEKIKGFLSAHLLNNLSKFFSEIEEKFYDRGNGHFSSGEKILISLMRVLTSWDRKVSILVVDECTVFLDTKIKVLFLRCLSELSMNTSVYLSAHEDFNLEKPTKINLEVIG